MDVEAFAAHIRAASREQPLRIRGGGSKDFYGGPLVGEVLDTSEYKGIVSFEPSELVITARAGTPLAEVEAALAEKGQFLPFEPPNFYPPGKPGAASSPLPEGEGPGVRVSGGPATIGGVVAAGLSGPRRTAVGAARDFVLGVKLMDGEARILTFGGQVMKNVAGYDISRLMAGSLGTLGLILEVSLKVLPRPVAERTLRLQLPAAQALERVNAWAAKPLSMSASCWYDGFLNVRLSGARAAVEAAQCTLGGDLVPDDEADDFWCSLREQTNDFFVGEEPLWRLSLPPTAALVDLPDPQLIEWNGAQRWLHSASPAQVRAAASAVGGHATLFRGGDKTGGVFTPLPTPLMDLHRRLKSSFDPRGIFDPGRLYPDF
jgi:glycolate dehydrogenase FAD-binding subunit